MRAKKALLNTGREREREREREKKETQRQREEEGESGANTHVWRNGIFAFGQMGTRTR